MNKQRLSRLSLPFSYRSESGKVSITLQQNKDFDHAWGLDLLFPDTPPSSFHGFPVITASITYPLSPSAASTSGYDSLFGWISLVKYQTQNSNGNADWAIDLYPWAKDLKSPFSYWGHCPTFFAAPAVVIDEKEHEGLRWEAQCFLCSLTDAGREKMVVPVSGAGFSWGFEADVVKSAGWGLGGIETKIVLNDLEELDVEREWKDRAVLLRKLYPQWKFLEAGTEY